MKNFTFLLLLAIPFALLLLFTGTFSVASIVPDAASRPPLGTER